MVDAIDFDARPETIGFIGITRDRGDPRMNDARAVAAHGRRRFAPGLPPVLGEKDTGGAGGNDQSLGPAGTKMNRPYLIAVQRRGQSLPVVQHTIVAFVQADLGAQKERRGPMRMNDQGADIALDKHAIAGDDGRSRRDRGAAEHPFADRCRRKDDAKSWMGLRWDRGCLPAGKGIETGTPGGQLRLFGEHAGDAVLDWIA